jgi:hypothetical protein
MFAGEYGEEGWRKDRREEGGTERAGGRKRGPVLWDFVAKEAKWITRATNKEVCEALHVCR